ncbi:YbaB/EbfC family nucleoid-associated protein [Chitinophaga tropicalis]|uniref:Nucleoid-associated protein GO493_03000 n=1 Tax=Chitinophaga tropicalis TaxID=2683588 RepID=A0A7K1TZQ2_9BACT|nr:YbaB/EbfC family nucleoid-associated protein [Chitinophaga tropicalis]MVT07215.1 YbaB/EbfC family nucleoid-associated protein [Chitinophaga tropicalis]
MFGDLFGKLQEAQEKMKESKSRLAQITMAGEAGEGSVKVVVTGNREVKSIDVAEHLLEKDNKEELEDLLITALNRALKNAEGAWEAEMKNVAGGMLGPLGGLL